MTSYGDPHAGNGYDDEQYRQSYPAPVQNSGRASVPSDDYGYDYSSSNQADHGQYSANGGYGQGGGYGSADQNGYDQGYGQAPVNPRSARLPGARRSAPPPGGRASAVRPGGRASALPPGGRPSAAGPACAPRASTWRTASSRPARARVPKPVKAASPARRNVTSSPSRSPRWQC
ncbi:hypothetical protein ACFQZ4_25395 [Catellatospora coxensis]